MNVAQQAVATVKNVHPARVVSVVAAAARLTWKVKNVIAVRLRHARHKVKSKTDREALVRALLL